MKYNNDRELIFIKELIQEAYKIDTNKTPILGIASHYIKYLMLDMWCNTIENKLLLLQILCKLILMYPKRLENIIGDLLFNFSFIENGTDDFYTLYSTINNLLCLKDKYENQPRWDKYYKKI